MNSFDFLLAFGYIDQEVVQRAIEYVQPDKSRISKNRNTRVGEGTAKNQHKRLGKTLMIAAVIVALFAAMCAGAFALNLFGLRELWQTPNRELSDSAAAYMQQQNAGAEEAGWSCQVNESLCDAATVMMTVTISGGDRFIIAPTDANAGDSVRSIGLDGDGTLEELAEAQGKRLLLVGASITGIVGASGNQSQRFQCISESEMTILVKTDKRSSSESIQANCLVYALEYTGERHYDQTDVQRVEMPLTLTEAPSEVIGHFAPEGENAIPGALIGEATVTKSALGIIVRFPITITDRNAMRMIIRMYSDETGQIQFTDFCDGDENEHLIQWSFGDGEVFDKLTVHFYDGNEQSVGTVVFNKNS